MPRYLPSQGPVQHVARRIEEMKIAEHAQKEKVPDKRTEGY